MNESQRDIEQDAALDTALQEMMTSAAVPEELSPAAITERLEAAQSTPKTAIRRYVRRIAGIAACLAVAVAGVALLYHPETRGGESGKLITTEPQNSKVDAVSKSDASKPDAAVLPALRGAASYTEVYKTVSRAMTTLNTNVTTNNALGTDSMADEGSGTRGETKADNVIDTFHQVDGVQESNVVKSDGRYLYYVCGGKLACVPVNSGKLGTVTYTEVVSGESASCTGLYLVGDSIVVLADKGSYGAAYRDGGILTNDNAGSWMIPDRSTEAIVYKNDNGKLREAGRFSQEGSYQNARLIGDTLYLLSSQGMIYTCCTDENFVVIAPADGTKTADLPFTEDVLAAYVPSYTVNGSTAYLAPADILLPSDGNETANYTMITGLDLSDGSIAPVSSKAVYGYTASGYCAKENYYICGTHWDEDSDECYTDITRIALDGGQVTLAANGSVQGRVLNQYAMDEYDGNFRIATTRSNVRTNATDDGLPATDNSVFVLDQSLKQIGAVTGLAPGETIQSVQFSGATAYVVTFRQTDPLFTIDLSTPSAPKVTDALKINGYSAFLSPWSDDLLLGFGVEANDSGAETGLKLTMFQKQSDGSMKPLDTWTRLHGPDNYAFSDALWDRQALLVSSEKNLISFSCTNDTGTDALFFAFKDGKFVSKGTIEDISENYYGGWGPRTVLIGDYAYVVGFDTVTAADLTGETVTRTDRTALNWN